jgi:BolA protein
MKIKDLILLIKKKINKNLLIENISIEDKSFLHKNHTGNDKNKYHLKLVIKSNELRKMKKIESTRKIYSILEEEMKKDIHSIQILII